MHMGWRMVVRVDSDIQAAEHQHRGHKSFYHNTQAFRFIGQKDAPLVVVAWNRGAGSFLVLAARKPAAKASMDASGAREDRNRGRMRGMYHI